jgi:hypothetical protein
MPHRFRGRPAGVGGRPYPSRGRRARRSHGFAGRGCQGARSDGRHRLCHAGAVLTPRPHAALLRRIDRPRHRQGRRLHARPQPSRCRPGLRAAASCRNRSDLRARRGRIARTEPRLLQPDGPQDTLAAHEDRRLAGRPHGAGQRREPVVHGAGRARRWARVARTGRDRAHRHRHPARRQPEARRPARARVAAARCGSDRQPAANAGRREYLRGRTKAVHLRSNTGRPTPSSPRATRCDRHLSARPERKGRPEGDAARPGAARRQRTACGGRPQAQWIPAK